MSFFQQITDYPLRTLKSCILGLLFVGLGMFIATLGPSLLDLQLLSQTTIKEIALLLPARSLGYAIGSMIAGVLGDMLDHQLVLMGSMMVSIVMMLFFPFFGNIYSMYSLIGIAGIANGCIDTIGNCWIIHIWGAENPPFMQVLHFMYGLGAFVAPFIVEPFLLINESNDTNSSSNGTEPNLIGTTDDLMIKWPFIITSMYYVLVLALFIFVYIRSTDNTVHPSRTKNFVGGLEFNESNTKNDKYRLKVLPVGLTKISIIAVATLCLHAYVGLEISFGSLLSPFAVKSNLHMTKSQGSFLTSSYWATYTFLRVFSLIAIIYFSPRTLLMADFAIIMFSNVILVPFANNHAWALWIGSSLMGLGCSSVFATIFAFVEQLTPITARMTALFMIAACAGEFVIPVVVSAYLEPWPPIFLWIVLLYSTISVFCVIGLFFIQHRLLKNQRSEQNELRTHSTEISTLQCVYPASDMGILTISHQVMTCHENGANNKTIQSNGIGHDQQVASSVMNRRK